MIFESALRGAALLVALMIPVSVVLADDSPSFHQVYEAAQAGRLDQAQAMMDQVLKAHPNSAKAHYVEAELLARQGRLANAKDALATAEKLSPGLPFAKPQSVDTLKARIAGGHTQASVPTRVAGTGLPIGTLLLGVGGLFLVVYFIRALTARRNMGPMMPSAAGQTYAPNTGPVGGVGGGGIGSGIVSGLATGAALGAGMVAGEALASRFMGGNHETPIDPNAAGNLPADDLGGNDFGINSDSSSWDDSGGDMSDLGGGGDWS